MCIRDSYTTVRRHGANPFGPLFIGETGITLAPVGTDVSKSVPLRSFQPTGCRNRTKGFVQFTRGVILRPGVANDLHPGIKGDDGIGVAVFDGASVNLRDGFVELDMFVAAVDP